MLQMARQYDFLLSVPQLVVMHYLIWEHPHILSKHLRLAKLSYFVVKLQKGLFVSCKNYNKIIINFIDIYT